MTSKLEQLKQISDVVADTGDIDAIRRYQPLDATTNPSLLLKAADLKSYRDKLTAAVKFGRSLRGSSTEQLAASSDHLAVNIGTEILSLIKGRVSTEIDARLSFDTRRSIERARHLTRLYNDRGIGNERVLIKVASTWEGIRAAEVLEQEGIHCNLTLLFGFIQAAACADAGVTLISPFVGRILDWYTANTDRKSYAAAEDPGVLSVTQIYNYFKANGYDTVIMGASFRNTGEIEQLAGCDRLTISPQLLEELANDDGPLTHRLDPATAHSDEARIAPDEIEFRGALNEDAMATEKLAEGIRRFAADQATLERRLAAL